MVRRPAFREPRNELLIGDVLLARCKEIPPPDDDALGRGVRDRADVAGEIARAARCSAQPRLEHRCGRTFAHRRAQRRQRRRHDGGDIGIGEERDCSREPVSGGLSVRADDGDQLALGAVHRRCERQPWIVELLDSRGSSDHRDERLSSGRDGKHPSKKALLALVCPQNPKPVEDGKRVHERAHDGP